MESRSLERGGICSSLLRSGPVHSVFWPPWGRHVPGAQTCMQICVMYRTLSPSSCASRRKSCGTTSELRMKRSPKGNFWSSRWRTWSTSWRPRATSEMTAADSLSRWRCVGTRLSHQGNVSYVGSLGFSLFLAWCFKIFSCWGEAVYRVVVSKLEGVKGTI